MAKLFNRNNRMNDLMRAAHDGDTSTVQSLITQGADVNAIDLEGASALIFASMMGHSATVQLLLNLGANIHTAKFDGLTALMYASMRGHVATINVLIAYGANLHAVDKYGNTALIIAALHDRANSIEVLIEVGAQVDTRTRNGATALMIASQNNHPAAVVALMAGGANINAVTQGFTAMRLASYNHHEGIVSIISGGLKCLQDTCRKRDEDVSLILKRLIAPVELRSYIISYDCYPSFEDVLPALGILKASVRRRGRNFTSLARGLAPSSYPLTTIYSSPINFNNGDIETKEHKEEGQSVAIDLKNRVEHQLPQTEEAHMVSSLSNFERALSTFDTSTRDTDAMTFRLGANSPPSSPRALLILSSNNSSATVSTLSTTSVSSPHTMDPRPVSETSIIAQRRKQQCIALSKRGL